MKPSAANTTATGRCGRRLVITALALTLMATLAVTPHASANTRLTAVPGDLSTLVGPPAEQQRPALGHPSAMKRGMTESPYGGWSRRRISSPATATPVVRSSSRGSAGSPSLSAPTT
jgi:hypothetical protein